MRDWLNSILGQDGGRVAQFALALLAVVLLILLLAWVVRRMQPGARLIAAAGGKTRKRLGVLEASDVDARRRLVLVRRDDVEHLIMIGGPNDLLVESRILRGGHPASRPNVQQMPRPATSAETDRFALSGAGTPPTSQSVPASAPIAQQAAPVPARIVTNDEPEFPVIAAIPLTTPFTAPATPPPFVPQQTRSPVAPVAPTPSAPSAPPQSSDPRRPSLSDLLSAAAAAKAADSRDQPQPITAPPPMPKVRLPQPDLEEDDREMPTQIVAYRPSQPPTTPAPAVALPTMQVAEPPASRETEVATQIERALATLNPPAPVQEPPPRAEPVAQMQMPLPRRPVQMDPAPAAAVTRPVPAAAAPTMPAIPPRPVPPLRPVLAELPQTAERPVYPIRAEQQAPAPQPVQVAEDRGPAEQPVTFAPRFAPEPATAPRPITVPVPRPPVAVVVEPPPAANPAPTPAVPVPTAKQKTDELEEEMAKLLSELGGSSTR